MDVEAKTGTDDAQPLFKKERHLSRRSAPCEYVNSERTWDFTHRDAMVSDQQVSIRIAETTSAQSARGRKNKLTGIFSFIDEGEGCVTKDSGWEAWAMWWADQKQWGAKKKNTWKHFT